MAMARRSAVVLVAAVLLCSCATTSAGINQTLAQCDGQPLRKAVDLLGSPETVQTSGAGGKVVRWSWIHASRVILVRMEVSADDRIVSTQWQYRYEGEPRLPENQPGLGIP